MGPVYYVAAALLALLGAAAAIWITWASGWNEFSDRMVWLRAAVFAFSLGAAAWVFGVAFAPNPLGRQVFAIALCTLAFQSVHVTAARRGLVAARRDGRPLPRGVSDDAVRIWSDKHAHQG